MWNPITVNIISDDETTPRPLQSKKQRTNFDSNPATVFIIDDEPTPAKSTRSTPSVVPETPSVVPMVRCSSNSVSDPQLKFSSSPGPKSSAGPEAPSVVPETPMVESNVPLVRCNNSVSDPQLKFSSSPGPKPSGLICLESDEESEGSGSCPGRPHQSKPVTLEVENSFAKPSTCSDSFILRDSPSSPPIVQDDLPQGPDHSEEDDIMDLTSKSIPAFNDFGKDDVILPLASKNNSTKDKTTDLANKKRSAGARNTKEEKARLMNDEPTPAKSTATRSTPSVLPETLSVVPETPMVRCRNSVSDPQLKISSLPGPKSSVGAETPSVVPETPMVESYVPLVRCNNSVSDPQLKFSSSPGPKPSGLICLESDEESEGSRSCRGRPHQSKPVTLEVENSFAKPSTCSDSLILRDSSSSPPIVQDDLPQVSDHSEEDDIMDLTSKSFPAFNDFGKDDIILPLASKNNSTKDKTTGLANKKKSAGARNTKEEKARLMNERKQQKEQEKLEKIALKAQAAEMKKMQKEIERWEKGKFAQQSIVAKIDTKVVEQGSIGAQLLTRLAEKGIAFQITSNPVERSIIWTMSVPENIAQGLTHGTHIPYVLLVFEAEEFCHLAADDDGCLFMDHVSRVQSIYPSHTLCYLTNRLLAYINKREQEHYKTPANNSGWSRPPVEKLLSKFTTHFVGVHSRLCMDESELAEHVVGLTCSLASCQFRKKLTRLSVNANGSLISKDATDRALIKKSTWLKALVAIPKVQPRFAVAIWKKYPTMKSLLSVYMDPTRSEREKELLLANLITEGLVGDNRRLGEICSKRVYRILMAQSGSTKTDDVENGADFFIQQSS